MGQKNVAISDSLDCIKRFQFRRRERDYQRFTKSVCASGGAGGGGEGSVYRRSACMLDYVYEQSIRQPNNHK